MRVEFARSCHHQLAKARVECIAEGRELSSTFALCAASYLRTNVIRLFLTTGSIEDNIHKICSMNESVMTTWMVEVSQRTRVCVTRGEKSIVTRVLGLLGERPEGCVSYLSFNENLKGWRNQ